MSAAARNARVYAATIAGLSKTAEDIRDSFTPGSEPTTAEIVAALGIDLSDGKLDGLNAGATVQIGFTGMNLPASTEQNFIDRVAQIQSEMPGIENVVFTAAGGGALSPAVPGDWGAFYWDSADWQ